LLAGDFADLVADSPATAAMSPQQVSAASAAAVATCSSSMGHQQNQFLGA